MRIIVISDTHGNYKALESVLLRNSDADWIFFLGDGERDLDTFLMLHHEFTEKIIAVCGNCDACSMNPGYFILPLPGGHSIFATHGHYYAVKSNLELIKLKTKEHGCGADKAKNQRARLRYPALRSHSRQVQCL